MAFHAGVGHGEASLVNWCLDKGLDAQARSRWIVLSSLGIRGDAIEEIRSRLSGAPAGASGVDDSLLGTWNVKRTRADATIERAATEYAEWCRANGFQAEGASCLIRLLRALPRCAEAPMDLDRAADEAARRGDVLEAARCLEALRNASPEADHPSLQARLDALGDRLAQARTEREAWQSQARDGLATRRAGNHPLHYSICLPTDWDPSRSWPLLVDVTGSGGQWQNTTWRAHAHRGYVCICPATVSNLNERNGKFEAVEPLPYDDATVRPLLGDHGKQQAWESDGLEAVVEDLIRDLNVDPERVVMTGLSGGGNLAYYSIFHRRTNFRAIAPRNPNFYPQNLDLDRAPREPAGGNYPVHIFEAGNDEYAQTIGPGGPPGVRPQTDAALAELRARGFTSVEHTTVPDVTHNESHKYYDRIFDWFDQVLGHGAAAPTEPEAEPLPEPSTAAPADGEASASGDPVPDPAVIGVTPSFAEQAIPALASAMEKVDAEALRPLFAEHVRLLCGAALLNPAYGLTSESGRDAVVARDRLLETYTRLRSRTGAQNWTTAWHSVTTRGVWLPADPSTPEHAALLEGDWILHVDLAEIRGAGRAILLVFRHGDDGTWRIVADRSRP